MCLNSYATELDSGRSSCARSTNLEDVRAPPEQGSLRTYFFFLPPPALVPPFGFLGALFEPGPLSGIVASSAWSERR